MARFSSTNQPTNRGRKKGPLDPKVRKFQDDATGLLADLMRKAKAGDMEAAKLVLPFVPKPKPYTAPDTIDARYLEARIKEMTELEQRLAALEAKFCDH